MSSNNNITEKCNNNMELFYKGNGFAIHKDTDSFYISWSMGIFGDTVCYKISQENVKKTMKSDQDCYEVMIYAETGKWPATNEEKSEITKEFIRNNPKLLLKVPQNQELFSKDELNELLKKAKKM